MIEMIEPTDPAERELAIKICRANCHLHPDTGLPDDNASQIFWKLAGNQLPYKKWIWMWNHGRAEWDHNYSVEAKDKP